MSRPTATAVNILVSDALPEATRHRVGNSLFTIGQAVRLGQDPLVAPADQHGPGESALAGLGRRDRPEGGYPVVAGRVHAATLCPPAPAAHRFSGRTTTLTRLANGSSF